MSVSLVTNDYLKSASNNVRSKSVPWEGYQRADLVTLEELALIKKVDRQPKTKIESVLLSDGPTYALLYLHLLKKLTRVDTIQIILVLIADSLADHEERVSLYTRTTETEPDLPHGPLLKALSESEDEFTQLKAAQIITVLLSGDKTSPLPTHILHTYLTAISNFIQHSSVNKRDLAVQCLESLLTRQDCRQAVWEMQGITNGFLEILRHNPSSQMSYQVAFCIWLLSFEQNIAEQIDKKCNIVPLLIEVAKSAAKEKVIRIIVAAFRNLLVKAPETNIPAMLASQLLPFTKNLSGRKWSDEDIMDDIQYLKDELTVRFESLSTWDEYTSELSSGHLSWTPVHESDEFWKENALKLNENDCKLLKDLLKLLNDAQEPLVIAVAAQDVGQYVKHCDRGKKLVTDLGGKARVMELMSHENADVRYRALMSVQQIVSHPWVSV
ncbi:ATPase V1 complex subunit H [Cylindrobasidium torrendii FP15055 ss-10]|uniref:V-type proton ATPase subunit H n=1 Tax=Cylindrobasidium torrendii FP15055 ss-10 TaxID=1314674 RepID=A0A0D7B7Y4_9AGAR|nr:ATPase V1 complex subunit H [Cylindrobasidium torrendii FP15055 ss-10]